MYTCTRYVYTYEIYACVRKSESEVSESGWSESESEWSESEVSESEVSESEVSEVRVRVNEVRVKWVRVKRVKREYLLGFAFTYAQKNTVRHTFMFQGPCERVSECMSIWVWV